jgi:hypothetical protein
MSLIRANIKTIGDGKNGSILTIDENEHLMSTLNKKSHYLNSSIEGPEEIVPIVSVQMNDTLAPTMTELVLPSNEDSRIAS